MELEEAVLILVLGYVAIMCFWLSGLSYLVLRKPHPLGVDGNQGYQIPYIHEESLYEGEKELHGALKKGPIELKEAPWEAEEETFQDEGPRNDVQEKKTEEDAVEQEKENSKPPEDEKKAERPSGEEEAPLESHEGETQSELGGNPEVDQKEQKAAPGGPEEGERPKDSPRICPKCEKKATYAKDYKRYYCNNCSEYLELAEEQEEPVLGKEEEPRETPLEKEEITSLGVENVFREDIEEEEHIEALKELEDEAQEQKKEEMARKQFAEQLQAPWKFEEELLNNEDFSGYTVKELKGHERNQKPSKEGLRDRREQRNEAQSKPMESEKKENIKESEEEAVYECPVCGYEIGADTAICPRCESELHSEDE